MSEWVGDRVQVRIFGVLTTCEIVGFDEGPWSAEFERRKEWYTLKPLHPIPVGAHGQLMPEFRPKYEGHELRPLKETSRG